MPARRKRMKRTGIARTSSLGRTARLVAKAPIRRVVRDTGPSTAVRDVVKARAAGRCEFPHCPSRGAHVHHRRPRGEGGDPRPETNRPSNLLYLCVDHHVWVESHRDDAKVFGLLMPWETPDPSKVPVSTRHNPWPVLLDDDGGWHVVPE